MGTWYCPGAPTWNCEYFDDRTGGWNTKLECCGYCNNCIPPGNVSQTWQCDSIAKTCSLKDGSGGFSTKELCDKACSGIGGSKCGTDQIGIFGSCYNRTGVYIAGIAIIGLTMFLKKKK